MTTSFPGLDREAAIAAALRDGIAAYERITADQNGDWILASDHDDGPWHILGGSGDALCSSRVGSHEGVNLIAGTRAASRYDDSPSEPPPWADVCHSCLFRIGATA